MELRLDDRVALITGGSRGIGKAIGEAYARAGAQVVLCARKPDDLRAAADDIGSGCEWLTGNTGRPEDAASVVGTVVERHGRVDVLVNNAAASPYAGPTIDIELPAWDKTIQVNLTGPFVWTQECWRRSMAEHGGVVLNVSSTGAMAPSPVIGVYDMTKFALLYLTQQLAAELGPKVRVNTILPGLVKTDFSRLLWDGEHGERYRDNLPLQKLGEPEDLAGMALFLASDQSRWITGQHFVVDGGGLVAINRGGVL